MKHFNIILIRNMMLSIKITNFTDKIKIKLKVKEFRYFIFTVISIIKSIIL